MRTALFLCAVVSLAAGCATQSPPSALNLQEPFAITDNGSNPRPPFSFSENDEALLDDIQRGCFNYFWNGGVGPAKIVPDRTSITTASIAGVGFQLSSLPIGVERGWVSREDAQSRAEAILKLLAQDPRIRHNGIFQHYIDPFTGGPHSAPTLESVASTIDHALFTAGAMTVSTYFGGNVATLADQLIAESNWRSYITTTEADKDFERGFISLGYRSAKAPGAPEGLLPYAWVDSGCEHRLVTFLAVCAPTDEFAVPPVV